MTSLQNGVSLLTHLRAAGPGLHALGAATGVLGFLLLSLSLVCGLLSQMAPPGARARLRQACGWCGGLAVYAGLVHALLLLASPPGAPGGAGVAFASLIGQAGVALALGIYGIYGLATAVVCRDRAGAVQRSWRWIHWLGLPAWFLSVLHVLLLTHSFGLGEGMLYGGCAAVVLILAALRSAVA